MRGVPAPALRDGWTLVESASQPDTDPTTSAGVILMTYRFGITSTGDPYFDVDGATAGEEAALWVTPDGEYVLVDLPDF